MKKRIIIVLCVLLTISLIFFLFYMLKRPTKSTSSSQETIKSILSMSTKSEYLYEYSLNDDKGELDSYLISGYDIYYLLDKDEYYELYSENISTSQVNKIGRLETYYSCHLMKEKNYITCNSEDKLLIYDLNLNLKYELDTTYNINDIIPYQDTFVRIENNSLILNENNKNVSFRTLKKEFNKDIYIEYFYTKDTTYLLYPTPDNLAYYLYDIKNDTYEKINSNIYHSYSNGFYFYDGSIFKIYNLKDNTIKEYNNPWKFNGDYEIVLSSDNNTFCFYNTLAKTIEIIDTENDTYKKATLDSISDESVRKLFYNDKYLFIITSNNANKFYRYDVSSLPIAESSFSEYVLEQERLNNKIVKDIKEKYNVTIHIKDDAIIEGTEFNISFVDDYRTVNNALIEIEKILNKSSIEFYNTFYDMGFKGLHIYFTGRITENINGHVSVPAGFATIFNNEYRIALDINSVKLSSSFCHELFHTTEFNLDYRTLDSFPNWSKYNPKDFVYNYSYVNYESTTYDYTEGIDRYFVDSYAYTYPLEDRASIFENVCPYESDSMVNEYPNLLAKAKYLKDILISNFPSLKDNSFFNSLATG